MIKNISNKLNTNFYIIIIIIISCVFRIITISMDSPTPIPADAAFRTDQGWYSHNALNKIQNDKWFYEEDRNEITHTALFSFIQYVNFKVFGVNLCSARIQPLFFSILLLIFSTLFFTKHVNKKTGLIFSIFFGINLLLIIYSRAALIEPTVSFFLFCAFAFLYLSKKNSILYPIFSGIFIFLAVIAKTHGIFFIFLFVLIALFELFILKINFKKIIVRYSLIFSAFILLYFLWYKIFIIPNIEYYKVFNTPHVQRIPQNLSLDILKGYLTSIVGWIYTLVIKLPIIFSLFVIALYKALNELFNKNWRFFHKNKLFSISILWVISHFLFFVGARYIRPRFQILCFIPLFFIAANLLTDKSLIPNIKKKKNKIFYLFFLMLLISINLFKLFVSQKNEDPKSSIVISTILVLLTFTYFYFNANYFKKINYYLLIFIYLSFNLIPYYMWVNNPTYSIINIGEKIKNELLINNDLETEYVLGPYSPTFALNGNFKSIVSVMHFNNKKTFEFYKPKYILCTLKNKEFFINEFKAKKLKWQQISNFDYNVPFSYKTSLKPEKIFLYEISYKN